MPVKADESAVCAINQHLQRVGIICVMCKIGGNTHYSACHPELIEGSIATGPGSLRFAQDEALLGLVAVSSKADTNTGSEESPQCPLLIAQSLCHKYHICIRICQVFSNHGIYLDAD